MDSPPKRVTRARAAAKTSTTKAPASSTGAVKVATASARAKATRSMPAPALPSPAAPAAPITRRRTRGMTEEVEDEHTQDTTQAEEKEPEKKTARTTRGRATRGKGAEKPSIQEATMEEAPLPAKPVTRTRRAAGKKAEETPVEVAAAVPLPEEKAETKAAAPSMTTRRAHEEPVAKPAPSRITRRVRTAEVPEESAPAAELPKRTVRSRATTVTKPAVTTRRTAHFEAKPEQDKENTVATAPAAKAKRVASAPLPAKKAEPEPAATGLRAKPVRKPATARTAAAKPASKATANAPAPAPAPRTTRGRAMSIPSKPIQIEELIKSPLSPKKVSQIPQPTPKAATPKEDSDDELATMEKTPMRPLEKTPFKAPPSIIATAKKLDFTTSIVANPATTNANPAMTASIMASPARRIPQSPWKGAIKDSPKKAGAELGQSLLQSPKKLGASFQNSPFKTQMAPPSSVQRTADQKKTLMQSPARRPPSPVKVSRDGSPTRAGPARQLFGTTPKPSSFGVKRFTTPKTSVRNDARPEKVDYSQKRPQTEARPANGNAAAGGFNDIKPFTGRLSSVLPRYADPVMRGEIGSPVITTQPEPSAQEEDAVMEEQSPAQGENADAANGQDEVVASTEMEEDSHNQMTSEEADAAVATMNEASMSTTPKASPLVNLSSGTYALRDESPFDDTESENDSEDELTTNSPLYTVKMSSADFAQLSTPQKKLNFQASKTPIAIGFTPLASKLDKWQKPQQGPSLEETLVAASPKRKEKEVATPNAPSEQATAPTPRPAIEALAAPSPAVPSPALPSSFFDDEMMIREDEQMIYGDASDTPLNLGEGVILGEDGEMEEDVVLDALDFAPEDIDDEDLDLVDEANELSMIEEMEEMDDYLDVQDEDDEVQDVPMVGPSGQNSLENSAQNSGQQSPVEMETEQDVTHAAVASFAEDAVVNAFNRSMDSALSEASQEYGDENAPPAEAPTSVPAEQAAAPTPMTARQREKMPSAAPTPPLNSRRLSTSRTTPKSQTPVTQPPSRRSSRPFTPVQRNMEQRTVHTVSKVSLKPAAADSPIKFSPRKMPATVARGDGSQIPRAKMATASSSTRSVNSTPTATNMRAGGMRSVSSPTLTPSRNTGNSWSNSATPARTPCRPQAEGVLKGAVVFVDVHTTEGADASAVFIDLLTQMGARCVKSWGWNPSVSPLSSLTNPPSGDAQLNSSTGSESSDIEGDSKKIGITHVVFKDGSKRTMEKVRDTKGVVSCVGVGWVLDCEREARWLPESDYKIDTAHVPRGGARRRKSMEPRALANMNGTLVTPKGEKGGVPQTEKPQRFGRRDSTQWVRTPQSSEEDQTPRAKRVDADGDIDMLDYSYAELSPLPQTPVPARISSEDDQHVLDKLNGVVPETPYGNGNIDPSLFGAHETPYMGKTPMIGGFTPYTGYQPEMTPIAATPESIGMETPQPLTVQKVAEDRNQLLMRTVPVKRNDGPSNKDQVENGANSAALMQRLMLARRKSLQWAPKIGSPLARGSNYSPQK